MTMDGGTQRPPGVWKAPLLLGERADAGPAGAAADGDRRGGDVADEGRAAGGDERDEERAVGAQAVDDGSLGASAVLGGQERLRACE